MSDFIFEYILAPLLAVSLALVILLVGVVVVDAIENGLPVRRACVEYKETK
jgi:hypothetical protein